MLDTTAEHMLEEITAAEALRDLLLSCRADRLRKFMGPARRGSISTTDELENYYFENATLTLPQLVYANPRVTADSPLDAEARVMATGMKLAINKWVRQQHLSEKLVPFALDFLFDWCAAVVVQEPDMARGKILGVGGPNRKGIPYRPRLVYLDPEDYAHDSGARNEDEIRFRFHRWFIDKEDLIEIAERDATWDADAIEALVPGDGLDEFDRPSKDVPERNEVRLYSVWVKEESIRFGPRQGYHGTIRTYASSTNQSGSAALREIRKPTDYYGPACGPYACGGDLTPPNESYPLSSITPIEGQIKAMNDEAKTLAVQAENYMRITVFDESDKKFAAKWRKARKEGYLMMAGFKRELMQEIESGGITRAALESFMFRKAGLDRVSGFGDAQKGLVTGQGLATEHALAAAAGDKRIAYRQRRFESFVRQILHKAGWFFFHDNRAVFPLGQEASKELDMESPWFHGGTHGAESGFTYEDLMLAIEVGSMERTDEQQRAARLTEVYMAVANVAPAMPQTPWIAWGDWLHALGEANNVTGLDRFLDEKLLGEAAQAQAESEPRRVVLAPASAHIPQARPAATGLPKRQAAAIKGVGLQGNENRPAALGGLAGRG